MGQHLVFYDGTCGFCSSIVQCILQYDKNKIFDFAPLQGSTAANVLKDLPEEMKDLDSLVLIENYKTNDKKFYVQGEGALRIAWLLEGLLSLLGIFNWIIPAPLSNWGYRLVARNRHRLLRNSACKIPTPETKDRFLP